MKKYRVTNIQIDFEDNDFELPPTIQEEITTDCLNRVWSAGEEDDLVDVITDFYGFCISSIDYEEKIPYVDAVIGNDPYAPAFKRESNLSE